MAIKVEYERPINTPIKEVRASCRISPTDQLIVSDCYGGSIWFGVKYGPDRSYPDESYAHPGVSLKLEDAKELHTLLGRMLADAEKAE